MELVLVHRHNRALTAKERQPDGLAQIDRRAVGQDRSAFAEGPAVAQGRPPAGGQPPLFRGDPVDSLDGRALERAAGGVRSPLDLLSPAPAVGSRWDVTFALAGLSGRAPGPTTGEVGRVLCGRELRSRKKGGLKVGKTKR